MSHKLPHQKLPKRTQTWVNRENYKQGAPYNLFLSNSFYEKVVKMQLSVISPLLGFPTGFLLGGGTRHTWVEGWVREASCVKRGSYNTLKAFIVDFEYSYWEFRGGGGDPWSPPL